MVKTYSTFAALLFASSVHSHVNELFFVNVEEIREIAIAAVYEKFPEYPLGEIIENKHLDELNVRCESALSMKLVETFEEDYQHCSVQLRYDIQSTKFENKYVDDNDLCMVSSGSESISVLVYSDGSTIVSRPGMGTSTGSVECTEEFEGLSK